MNSFLSGAAASMVYLTAAMVVVLGVLRLVAYHVEGSSDSVLTQAFTACVTLFVGSVAIARGVRGGSNGGGS